MNISQKLAILFALSSGCMGAFASVVPQSQLQDAQGIFNQNSIKSPLESEIFDKLDGAKGSNTSVSFTAQIIEEPIKDPQVSTQLLYSFQNDIHGYIRKLHNQNGILLNNTTEKDVVIDLKTKAQSEKNKVIKMIEKIIVPANSYFVFDNSNHYTIYDVIIHNNKDLFLNPKWTYDSQLELKIQTTEDRHFLYQEHDYDFHTKPFSQEEIDAEKIAVDAYNAKLRAENPGKPDNMLPLKVYFKEDYNNNLYYMDYMLKEEGTSIREAQDKYQALHEENNFGKLVHDNPKILDNKERVPLITHKIWLTNPNKPVNMPEHYIKWLENSIKYNSGEDGWVHYLWVQDKNLLPDVVKRINHPAIKIMEVGKDMPEEMVCNAAYEEALKANKFGMASDVLRMELLNQMGGIYLDTDYEVFQSMKGLNTMYDFYCAIEPMSNFICNAIVAAAPHHPVIQKALELIKRNSNPETVPAYIAPSESGFRTILVTGPGMITAAVSLAAGQDGYRDMVFPSNILYPVGKDAPLPNKDVLKPNQPAPAECFGAHYWETAWMRAEFGSGG
ncbi:MAG TPA: glycosyltransferase [Candidatus Nitrosotenuis sp.]|jgi:hypothetical protein|nr:glycosyltransferase [Candidatus Nitrosotenuis sp.]